MIEVEKKPFFVSDDEKKELVSISNDDISEQLISGVPELTRLVVGQVVCDHTIKDGLLIFHFYKMDRKDAYDRAQDAMSCSPREQQDAIAEQANASLAEIPWWPEFEAVLNKVFSDEFKHQQCKINFYPEVDSWSAILPEPNMPGAASDKRICGMLAKIDGMVTG